MPICKYIYIYVNRTRSIFLVIVTRVRRVVEQSYGYKCARYTYTKFDRDIIIIRMFKKCCVSIVNGRRLLLRLLE